MLKVQLELEVIYITLRNTSVILNYLNIKKKTEILACDICVSVTSITDGFVYLITKYVRLLLSCSRCLHSFAFASYNNTKIRHIYNKLKRASYEFVLSFH